MLKALKTGASKAERDKAGERMSENFLVSYPYAQEQSSPGWKLTCHCSVFQKLIEMSQM